METSAEAASRITTNTVSGTGSNTLIWLIRNYDNNIDPKAATHIGIDDWAFKKWTTYVQY